MQNSIASANFKPVHIPPRQFSGAGRTLTRLSWLPRARGASYFAHCSSTYSLWQASVSAQPGSPNPFNTAAPLNCLQPNNSVQPKPLRGSADLRRYAPRQRIPARCRKER
jgi:hypothetical protein